MKAQMLSQKQDTTFQTAPGACVEPIFPRGKRPPATLPSCTGKTLEVVSWGRDSPKTLWKRQYF